MIKQCSEITYFERWQPLLQEICFDFFSRENPGVEKVINLMRNLKNHVKVTEPEKRALNELIKMFNQDVNTYEQRLDGVRVDLKKINEGKLTPKQYNEYMDSFYMARMGVKIENNTLHIHLKDQETDKDEGNTYNAFERMLWSLYHYDRAGRNNIRVEEQLTQELILTDVKGVTANFLKLPHKSFALFLPHNKSLTIRKELIRQIYLHETIREMDGKVYRKIELCFIDVNGNIESNNVLFDDEKSLVEQAAAQIISRYNSRLAKKEITGIMNFVMSVILYINSTDKVEQVIMPSVLMKNRHTKLPCCALGYGILINKEVYASEPTGRSHQINVLKFTVRGHFRTYKTGEDKRWKVDTVIWIRPHIKGRERDNEHLSTKPKDYFVK